MRILAIDYGKSKIGLAKASTPLAEPYKVIRYKKVDEVIEKIIDIINKEKIEKIVVGVSEGNMETETVKFSKILEENIEQPIVYQDETLSTKDAQRLSINSGMKRKKRQEMEDAFAATIILQSFLDNE